MRTHTRYRYFNPNPNGTNVGDCAIRAICAATGKEWDDVFVSLSVQAYSLKDMPSANRVWGRYLKQLGYVRHTIQEYDMTVEEFAETHEHGKYILCLDGHVVCVDNGYYYDTWDSGDGIPIYYFTLDG